MLQAISHEAVTDAETASEAGLETQAETHTREAIRVLPPVHLKILFPHLSRKHQSKSKGKKTTADFQAFLFMHQ